MKPIVFGLILIELDNLYQIFFFFIRQFMQYVSVIIYICTQNVQIKHDKSRMHTLQCV